MEIGPVVILRQELCRMIGVPVLGILLAFFHFDENGEKILIHPMIKNCLQMMENSA
jgi:hypothetical protein